MHDVVHTFSSCVASILLISFAVADFGEVLTSSPNSREPEDLTETSKNQPGNALILSALKQNLHIFT